MLLDESVTLLASGNAADWRPIGLSVPGGFFSGAIGSVRGGVAFSVFGRPCCAGTGGCAEAGAAVSAGLADVTTSGSAGSLR
jgi:hypothetical protein